MFLRFASAVVVVGLISLAGTMLETRILDCRLHMDRQEDRMIVLRAQFARLRSDTRQLGAPVRLLPPATAGWMPTSTRR